MSRTRIPTDPVGSLSPRAPRLFVDPERLPAAGELLLDGPSRHYLGRVLRLVPGDQVVLLDGLGRVCAATVARIDAEQAALRIVEPGPEQTTEQATGTERAGEGGAAEPAGIRLTLLCGLLKGEKQDFVVQKATELGTARIVPVACRRSVPQLDSDRGEKKQQRWQRIALAAAQQCRRLDVPEVTAPTAWAEALKRPETTRPPIRLLLYEGVAPPLGAVLRRAFDGGAGSGGRDRVVEILIGPEGGFTADEVIAAIEAGFVPASLGPLTLRAETAVVAALAVVRYALAAGASTDTPDETALDMAGGS